jgi:peroxiredoxin Q/BCP
MQTVQLNQTVPDFIVPATSNKNVQLSMLRGYNVILYFYPKDNTPGCTIESQDFGANYNQFRDLNTIIFGVSRDSLESHESFKEKQSLPFELISDEQEALCQLFDVVKEKDLYGKKVHGVVRSTFLIDQNGVLISEWRDVQVKEHVHQVLDRVRQLLPQR